MRLRLLVEEPRAVPQALKMSRELSNADWEELAVLIEDAPPERLRLAMNRLQVETLNTLSQSAPLATGVERLFQLGIVSSGSDFDRALLQELRRLSVH